jgi:hypothetical protein
MLRCGNPQLRWDTRIRRMFPAARRCASMPTFNGPDPRGQPTRLLLITKDNGPVAVQPRLTASADIKVLDGSSEIAPESRARQWTATTTSLRAAERVSRREPVKRSIPEPFLAALSRPVIHHRNALSSRRDSQVYGSAIPSSSSVSFEGTGPPPLIFPEDLRLFPTPGELHAPELPHVVSHSIRLPARVPTARRPARLFRDNAFHEIESSADSPSSRSRGSTLLLVRSEELHPVRQSDRSQPLDMLVQRSRSPVRNTSARRREVPTLRAIATPNSADWLGPLRQETLPASANVLITDKSSRIY